MSNGNRQDFERRWGQNAIEMDGPLDMEMMGKVTFELEHFRITGRTEEIKLIVNSSSGLVTAAILLVQYLKSYPSTIATYALTVRGPSCLIVAWGTQGHRFAFADSIFELGISQQTLITERENIEIFMENFHLHWKDLIFPFEHDAMQPSDRDFDEVWVSMETDFKEAFYTHIDSNRVGELVIMKIYSGYFAHRTKLSETDLRSMIFQREAPKEIEPQKARFFEIVDVVKVKNFPIDPLDRFDFNYN